MEEWKRKRRERHRAVKRYMKLREDLQLCGKIPTVPEGAVRDERVDPKTQSEQEFPELVEEAMRRGWSVPDEKKPEMVDRLIGVVISPEVSDAARVKAFGALLKADKFQYECDNPEAAGIAAGGAQVNVTVPLELPYEQYRKALEEAARDTVGEKIEKMLEEGEVP